MACDIGVIGLAVMGQNLVLNMEEKGHSVAVYNRTESITKGFIAQRTEGKKIKPSYSLEELVDSLDKPRKIMLMVKAGAAVDIVIDNLIPLLDKGDIIIDGGNSHFQDTNRRCQKLEKVGINYLGTGVSGGEYGALHGPSIMPGGSKEAYQEVEGILKKIAAQSEGGPCVCYLGPNSSGHYVKMVHNAIEYAVMEIIAEIYDLMRKGLKIGAKEMSTLFEKWNQEHQSYLIEISYKILAWDDQKSNKPLVDMILDRAKQKGTGKWSVQDAFNLGVPIPTISSAVTARYLSSLKDKRVEISKLFEKDYSQIEDKEAFLKSLEESLYLAIVIAYAEGMDLLKVASLEYDYDLDLAEVARIWEDGCIIRSSLLKPIQDAFKEDSDLDNLILAQEFKNRFKENIFKLRQVVTTANKLGIPIPALSSALSYFDGLKTKDLPANLIQGQRDYFGAHTYERTDETGDFHTEWQDIHNITK